MVSSFRTLFAIVATAAIGLIACDRSPSTTSTTTTTQQTTQATTSAIDASDFALDTVTSLVSNGGVNDLAALEAKINDPASGINNVDYDKDGKVDYVSISESGTPGSDTLKFMAHPSGDANATPVEVASVTVNTNTTTQTVQVAGNYPSYVNGYQDNSYMYNHQGLTFGDAVLLSMLMRPHAYYAAPMPMYYGRPVMSGSSLGSTRSSFQTNTRVAPIQKVSRPSTYQSPPAPPAMRAPSTRTMPRESGSIGGNANQMRDFSVRSPSAPRPGGNSFAPSTRSAPAPAPRSPSTFSAPRSVPRAPSGSRSGGRR